MRINSLSGRWGFATAVAGVWMVLLAWGMGCSGDKANTGEQANVSKSQAEAPASGARGATIEGVVRETMDSGGYTYVMVDAGDGPVWAAGPLTDVSVGQRVTIATTMEMKGFHSDTLDRTFDTLYFVSSFSAAPTADTGGSDMEDALKSMPGGKDVTSAEEPTIAPGSNDRTALAKEVTEKVEKAPGGLSVAEVHAGRDELAGKLVRIRGKVVKFTPRVMGTNWIHLQDGTCDGKFCDIAVTTDDGTSEGAVVTIEGTLAVNKDFGAGYRYEVIVEKATLFTEPD